MNKHKLLLAKYIAAVSCSVATDCIQSNSTVINEITTDSEKEELLKIAKDVELCHVGNGKFDWERFDA